MQDFKDHFDFLKLLGEGAYGKVFKVRMKDDNKIYALKLMDESFPFDSLKQEFDILKIINCSVKNIPCYYGITDGIYEGNKYSALLMEYIEGHDLYDFINEKIQTKTTFTPEEMLKVMQDSLEALVYLHSRGVAHRDIKPANIMVTNTKIVLVDYGFSCVMDIKSKHKCQGAYGTPNYMAPEIALYEPSDPKIWMKGDIYSLGQTFWSMTNLQEPKALISKPSIYLPEIADIIDNMTMKSASNRITAKQALDRVKLLTLAIKH